jgi:hypothetical protein
VGEQPRRGEAVRMVWGHEGLAGKRDESRVVVGVEHRARPSQP